MVVVPFLVDNRFQTLKIREKNELSDTCITAVKHIVTEGIQSFGYLCISHSIAQDFSPGRENSAIK
jgi:hypothetical protein